MFAILYRPEAATELRAIRAYDRVRMLEAIAKHLTSSPMAMEGPKKRLDLDDNNFIYQLRVGEFRVFYDVDEEAGTVTVRHVRRKGRRTTGEIL